MFTVIAHPQLRGKTPAYFRNSMAISDQFHQHCHWLSPTCWPAHHVTGPSHQDSPCLNDVNATPLHFMVALSCVATSRRQKQLHSGQPYPDSPATSRQRRHCHRQLPAKSPRHHHSIRTSGSQLLQPSPNQAGLRKDEELQAVELTVFIHGNEKP